MNGSSAGHRVEESVAPGTDGRIGITLSSPAGVLARFVPDAAMIGFSLTRDGVEVLGLRHGMAAYLADAKTFGIPLLAPWANRLGGDDYTIGGVAVSVVDVPGVHRDGNGLPIHGLLAGSRGWRTTTAEADEDAAWLSAEIEFDIDRPEFPAFPFPHRLAITARLSGEVLTVTTVLTPTGPMPVPVAFGWHPYFSLPGAPREEWSVELPFTEHLELDDRSLPTGEVTAVPPVHGALGGRTFDDLYAGVDPGTRAAVAAGGLRVTMDYVDGYDYAVVYAPAGEDLLAIEPMTAPTDPFSGVFELKFAPVGGSYSATFAISVTEVGR